MLPASKPGKHLHRLSQLIESGNFAAAEKLAADLSHKHPNDADLWYMLAGLYARRGVIQQVIDCCKHVTLINPGHAGAHYNLAAALQQAGRLDEARASFGKCLETDPGNLSAILGLGKLLSHEHLHAEALSCFDRATVAAPRNAEAFFCQGVARQALGQTGPALDSYRHAIQLRPDYFEATNNIGHILNEQGKLNEAIATFRKLLALRPHSAEIHNNLGVVYESQGKLEEAESAYRQALALNPSLAETRSHLGFLLAGEGKTQEALQCFDAALDTSPGHETAVAGKAVALEKLGRFDDAFTVLEPLVDAGSTNADVVLAWCKVMLRRGTAGAATDIAERILATESIPPKGIADLHFALGDLYNSTGDYSRAFSHYQRANRASPCTHDHDSHVQHIDRIIDATGKQVLAGLPRAQAACKEVVFIVGMPRSGTSLVEQILASHPDVFGAGELRHIGDIAASLSAAGKPVRRYPAAIGGISQADVDALSRHYLDAVQQVSDRSRLITDKMPHNFLYLGLISLLLPNARIIHVSRAPLDNCLSLYFHGFNPMHSYTTDLAMLGRYYREYQRLMKHWRETLNIPLLDIRYEDVVDDLQRSTGKLLDFCGLDWSDACLDFHRSDRFVKTPSYDQVRRPLYTSSIGRWKRYREFIEPLESALETANAGSSGSATSSQVE